MVFMCLYYSSRTNPRKNSEKSRCPIKYNCGSNSFSNSKRKSSIITPIHVGVKTEKKLSSFRMSFQIPYTVTRGLSPRQTVPFSLVLSPPTISYKINLKNGTMNCGFCTARSTTFLLTFSIK